MSYLDDFLKGNVKKNENSVVKKAYTPIFFPVGAEILTKLLELKEIVKNDRSYLRIGTEILDTTGEEKEYSLFFAPINAKGTLNYILKMFVTTFLMEEAVQLNTKMSESGKNDDEITKEMVNMFKTNYATKIQGQSILVKYSRVTEDKRNQFVESISLVKSNETIDKGNEEWDY